jgi:hypothetical protein
MASICIGLTLVGVFAFTLFMIYEWAQWRSGEQRIHEEERIRRERNLPDQEWWREENWDEGD